jgi:hypothetical protein
MYLSFGLALAFSAILNGSTLQAANATALTSMPQSQTVEEYVRAYFADEPLLADIAGCESHFRQYDKKGSVLRGESVREDVGLMQINETYHKDIADELGLDLNTMQGNLAYGRYLYEKQGSVPWNSSKACWGKSKNAQASTAVAMNK